MTLSDINDTHVGALLDLTSEDDYTFQAARHLMHEAGCEDRGYALLSEALRIADELTREEEQHLLYAADGSGTRHTIDAVVAERLVNLMLATCGHNMDGRYRFRITPAGRLVLALRNRAAVSFD